MTAAAVVVFVLIVQEGKKKEMRSNLKIKKTGIRFTGFFLLKLLIVYPSNLAKSRKWSDNLNIRDLTIVETKIKN